MQVAMVLQKNELFSGTIKENLRWGNEDATDEELIARLQARPGRRLYPGLSRTGYDTYIEQGGTNVSGGQKQRLCIARALLKKPKILILDDSTSRPWIRQRTRRSGRPSGRRSPDTTKFIIAQRISSVEDADLHHRHGRAGKSGISARMPSSCRAARSTARSTNRRRKEVTSMKQSEQAD